MVSAAICTSVLIETESLEYRTEVRALGHSGHSVGRAMARVRQWRAVYESWRVQHPRLKPFNGPRRNERRLSGFSVTAKPRIVFSRVPRDAISTQAFEHAHFPHSNLPNVSVGLPADDYALPLPQLIRS